MKIFGHPLIKSEKFYRVSTIEEIRETPPNSVVLIDDMEIAHYCKESRVPYTIEIDSIKDAIFANLLEAKYIICQKELSVELMPIAQNYLFDTEILVRVSKDSEIEEMAKIGVDGIVLL